MHQCCWCLNVAPLPSQSAWVISSPAGCHVFTPMQALLHAAVASGSPAEQLAADRLLEAYCSGNAAGQGVLAGSLLNAAAAPHGCFGAYLLLSLGQQGSVAELAASSRAAAALSHLIPGNEGLRPHLLATQVPLQQPLQQLGALKSAAGGLTGAVSLMTLCTAHLGLLVTQHGRQPASLQAAADTLRLLLLWLPACLPGTASAAAGAAAAAGGGGVSEDEVEQRVAAAREEAAAEAQAEADEAMTDLLVCLGQEEAKVGRGGDGVCSLLPFRLCWMYMRLSGMDSPLPTIVAALVPFRWVALSSLSTGSNPTIYSLAAPFTFCSTM